MENRWTQSGADESVRQWGDAQGRDVALRLYSARLIGCDPALVLHGGGNVSFKGTIRNILGEQLPALFVKASGYDLSDLDPCGLPGLDLAALRHLGELPSLDDDEMVNQMRRCAFDTGGPTPSIETLVHAFIPHRFVDHSHADSIIAVANQPDGTELLKRILGDDVAIIEYVRPGFDLAKAVSAVLAQRSDLRGIVLRHHGLITFGDDARESYARHIEIVDQCERFIAENTGQPTEHYPAIASDVDDHSESARLAASRAAIVGPILRGAIAFARADANHDCGFDRSIMEWRSSSRLLRILGTDNIARLAATGPLTGDHLIHTKPRPLLVTNPNWSDLAALRAQIHEAVERYHVDYAAYLGSHGDALACAPSDVDPNPRVVWLAGVGLLCFGGSKRHARVVADLAEHTIITKEQADAVGAFTSLEPEHMLDLEFRALQRRKLGTARGGGKLACPRPLEGQVVAISGGAGAIGFAVADECAAAGAHVAITDVDDDRVASGVARINAAHGQDVAFGVGLDVTDESSVRAGYDRIIRHFGGVDVVVPCAGVAHVAPIADMELSDFRRVMEINATGYLLFMREGIRILKAQGLGGHIVVIASKNVFGPGKDFGAYSASKAAGHQLGKVAAIELAPDGIRVNMINADGIFGDEDAPSGLWQTVGPERAKSRNLTQQQLPEYYRRRNLLQTRVTGRHVGRAVVFFASNLTPTTGATLPVDGGVVEAFPR